MNGHIISCRHVIKCTCTWIFFCFTRLVGREAMFACLKQWGGGRGRDYLFGFALSTLNFIRIVRFWLGHA